MVHLTSAIGSFHAQVIAARLHTEGINSHLKGVGDWPWVATGEVKVYVAADDFEVAAELLLFDRVDAVFGDRGLALSARPAER